MNIKLITLGMLGMSVAFASCSSDEKMDAPVDGSVINFSAVTPNGSRTEPTTTATLNKFVVYAFTEGSTLIDGATVTKTGGSWTYSPEAYWPVEPVNFYAFSPDITNSPDIKGMEGGNIPDYQSPGNVDLLYSVKTGVKQQAAPVLLNFRHALARVKVMMSSTNQRITVKVNHISLCNVYLQGTFNFPNESTLASTPDVKGTWTKYKALNKPLVFYAIGAEDQVTLTSVPTDYTEGNLNYNYVIPQPLTDVSLVGDDYAGTYIQVDCEIYDTASGVKLWPNSHTPAYMLVPETECGRIVYPTTSDKVKSWEQGHEYIYNIAINNPDVLDKIEFDVAVDDYVIEDM